MRHHTGHQLTVTMSGDQHIHEIAALPGKRHHDQSTVPKRNDERLTVVQQSVRYFFADSTPAARNPDKLDILRRDPCKCFADDARRNYALNQSNRLMPLPPRTVPLVIVRRPIAYGNNGHTARPVNTTPNVFRIRPRVPSPTRRCNRRPIQSTTDAQ